MLFLLSESGFSIVSDPEGANVAIVNTCGFIESAKEEAIGHILEMAELKKSGRLKRLIVCGCLAQRYKNEILAELPEIDAVLGVGSYGEIVNAVRLSLEGGVHSFFGDKNNTDEDIGRAVSTGKGAAYLKIAEGCDNRCSFCVIPEIRGKYRSRPMDSIVAEAGLLAESGVKELIVIAQDITRYGTDIYGERRLTALLAELAKLPFSWIRLHYLYPDAIDDDLIAFIAGEEKILKYLDIPIQHIDGAVLKRMRRRGTGGELRLLFNKLRERIPGLVIRTSLIVGHPGEGEEEFNALCEFLREAKIERAGVFVFSPQEGTPAAEMSDRCDEATASRRAELVMELQAEIMDGFADGQVGKTLPVLIEAFDSEKSLFGGRSWADSPDVDARVFIEGKCEIGEITEVIITGAADGDIYGNAVIR
jgi:ribosomal protein S12 methylthiotransferase